MLRPVPQPSTTMASKKDSTMAPDSAKRAPSTSSSGAAPSGCIAFSSGGDGRVTGARVYFTSSYGTSSSSQSQTIRSDWEWPR